MIHIAEPAKASPSDESPLPSYEAFLKAIEGKNIPPMSHEEAGEFAKAIIELVQPGDLDSVIENAGSAAALLRTADDGTAGLVTPTMVREMRTELRRVPNDVWPADLLACESVDEVLAWLQPLAQRRGLRNIRYYPLTCDAQSGYRLISYASVGHDEDTAQRLRVGQITKFLSHSPLDSHDSFWSILLRTPTVFKIDNRCRSKVEAYFAPDAVPLVHVAEDHCMNVLVRHRSAAWVDIPLLCGSKTVGKVSCDLETAVTIRPDTVGWIERDLNDSILQFTGLVQLAAAQLDALHRQEMDQHQPSPDEIGQLIDAECESPADLFRFCTEEMSKLLNCRYGSILTRVRDSLGADLLVLQKTSYPQSQYLEGIGHYHRDEPALTTWVARTGRSVCLQDLGDRSLLNDKLLAYDRELIWANKIPDSDNHGDLLIVPVWYKHQVVAVLRYTARRDGHFTERDQRWVEKIASKYIGPTLEYVRRRVAESLWDGHRDKVAALSVREAVTFNDTAQELAEYIGTAAKEIFPTGGKVILVNMLDGDRRNFRHYAVINSLDANCEESYPVAGSLTGYALQQPGVAYLADLASAEAAGHYRSVFRQARCALACRMGPSHQPSGAIVALSDCYDISEQVHGPALKLLAERAGGILWRRAIKTQLLQGSHRSEGFKAALCRLETVLSRPVSERQSKEIQVLLLLLRPMLDAVLQDRPADARFSEVFDEFSVKEAIDLAVSLAQSELPHVEANCIVDPNLRVIGQRGFFVTILFDVLRHGWQLADAVSIHAERERKERPQWLDVRVECVTDSPFNSRRVKREEVFGTLDVSPELIELPGPSELARAYRLPDGRTGNLSIDRDDGESPFRCTFRLPIASKLPQPSI